MEQADKGKETNFKFLLVQELRYSFQASTKWKLHHIGPLSPIWCSVFHQHTWKHSTWPVKAEGKHSTGHAPYLPSAVFTLRTLSGKKMKLPVNNYTSHLCHTPRFTQILQTTTSITGGEQEESRSLWQRKFKSRQHVRPCTHSLSRTHSLVYLFTPGPLSASSRMITSLSVGSFML